jgi:hypothetical protein
MSNKPYLILCIILGKLYVPSIATEPREEEEGGETEWKMDFSLLTLLANTAKLFRLLMNDIRYISPTYIRRFDAQPPTCTSTLFIVRLRADEIYLAPMFLPASRRRT